MGVYDHVGTKSQLSHVLKADSGEPELNDSDVPNLVV